MFWGNPVLQGLHIGIFIAIGALVAYWLILSRTTLGFRVRAVGRNPEAARYGGISVAKSYFLAMAISGAFAGLGGAMDILGWQFRLGVLDIQRPYDRLHRHRRRPAGAQHRRRGRVRRAALRRPPLRHLDAEPRPGRLRPQPRRKPHHA